MSTTMMQAFNQWVSRPVDQRFENIAELSAAVKGRRMNSRSEDTSLLKVRANVCNQEGEDSIVFNHGLNAVEPSHWSFGQFASWIKAPANYLRSLTPALASRCINEGIEKSDIGTLKFMSLTREDRDINSLQAVTSITYGRIWDADVVDGVNRLVERSDGKFYNPKAYATPGQLGGAVKGSGLYASDRDIFVFLIDGGSILDAGPRALLNRGVIIWNSEVGSRTFGLKTFLFNTVCGNHIIWGASSVDECIIRHSKNGPYRFDAEAAPALLSYANASAAPIEAAVKKAQDLILVQSDCKNKSFVIQEEIGKRGKFTRGELREMVAFAKSEEGDCVTLWQCVQGLTAYARGFDFIDTRTDLETRAGKLLDAVN